MTPRLVAVLAVALVGLMLLALAIAMLWEGLRPPPPQTLSREEVDRLAASARERGERLWATTTGWRDV